MADIRASRVRLKMPWLGEVELKVDDRSKEAAWKLYVELATRVAIVPLGTGEGRLREAMNSLYEVFAVTRGVLKEAGPRVGGSRNSVGGIAMRVLDRGLRPFLSKWHPRLAEWESRGQDRGGALQREADWGREAECRRELLEVQGRMKMYCRMLARIAGVNQ